LPPRFIGPFLLSMRDHFGSVSHCGKSTEDQEQQIAALRNGKAIAWSNRYSPAWTAQQSAR
jgi:hypothetical protein